MSRFLQVYMEDKKSDLILTEDLDLPIEPIEESIGSIMASVKEKLIKWFKWVKEKVVGFFKHIKEFIGKIAIIAIKQIKMLYRKCEEFIKQAKQGQTTKEAAYTDEELKDAHLKGFLWTDIANKVAGGFNGASFNEEFLDSVYRWFDSLKKAATNYDKSILEDAKYVERDKFTMDNNYFMIQVLGTNVQIQTHEFNEAFSSKCINQAKEVCTNVVTKVQAKFDTEIREIENKIKSKDVNSEYSGFVQTCVNKMANLSNFVKNYIMNKIYSRYVTQIQRAAYLRTRYKTYKMGEEVGKAFADAVSNKWSISSAIKSLFKSSKTPSPATA